MLQLKNVDFRNNFSVENKTGFDIAYFSLFNFSDAAILDFMTFLLADDFAAKSKMHGGAREI